MQSYEFSGLHVLLLEVSIVVGGASYILLADFFYMADLWGALVLITSVWMEL